MSAAVPVLGDLIEDGRWLAHRFDADRDCVQFRFVPPEAQRKLNFLTDIEIGAAPIAVYSRSDCLEEARKRELPAPRIIFHSAYCCSTLLARAFDLPGFSFGLKEPQIFNDLVGMRLRGADPRQVAAAMDVALYLLARPPGGSGVNVIKPSNLLNPMIPLVSALRPGIRAVLLHAPLETFLASIAAKEIEGRAWVRELMWKLIRLGMVDRFSFTDEDLYRQTDLQAAAVAWLAQQSLFAAAAREQAGFRTLNSETLLAEPARSIAALAELFEIPLDAADVPARSFGTHSKQGGEYSVAERAAESRRRRQVHEREIGIVLEWANRVADEAGVPMNLPARLIR